MFADVRGSGTVDWIEEHTAGATFCRRSDLVKEVKGGKVKPDLITCHRDHNLSVYSGRRVGRVEPVVLV